MAKKAVLGQTSDFNELAFDFNKVILDPRFAETLKEVNQIDISLPEFSTNFGYNFDNMLQSAELVTPLGKIGRSKLDPENGIALFKKTLPVSAYDESILKFQSLEGSAFFTSHSLVLLDSSDYIPANYVTFYFYTRSQHIVKKSKYIRLSKEPEIDSKKDYIKDRINFLHQVVPNQSILLIDGPLIGGDVYTFMIKSIEDFHEREIIPIFFVKNSSSNLVVDNVPELRNNFNSDMHWSYSYLKAGYRSNYFMYKDRNNPKNTKVFCYLKAFNISPQRIEMHTDTFNKYQVTIDGLMDLVYYLVLVQGEKNNPQVRPIAIAEKYARETLKLINIYKLIKEVGIMPTMNQTRFGS